jgi:phospholipid-binding lipoprotein MlaA
MSTKGGHSQIWFVRVMIACITFALMGCAAAPTAPDKSDPLEPMNRKIYAFNDTLDRWVLEPVSNAYVKVTPKPVQTGVRNFFNNLGYPYIIVNDVFQGRIKQSLSDSAGFFLNTTVGIGGIFDVASGTGLKTLDQNFGATAGVWGIGEGAYLVLPFLGPSSLRGLPGVPLALVTHPIYYVNDSTVAWTATGLGVISQRAALREAIKRARESLDPYVFVRSAYRQHQNYLIYGGEVPPQNLLEDLDIGGSAPPNTPKQ